MNTTTIVSLGLMAVLLVSTGCITAESAHDETTAGQDGAVRIGVFDTRGVALAYGRSARSDCFLAKVDDIKRQHDRAERTGDEPRMRALEEEAVALQQHIHEQVFSGASIDEVLPLIADDFAQVAQSAGVDIIVQGVVHKHRDVALVDVTLDMCAPFQPDAETLQAIKELLAKPPVPVSELSHDH